MHELSRVITSRASYRPRFPNLFIGKLGVGRLSYPYGERYEAIASFMKASAHDRNKPVWRPFHFIDHLLNTNQFEREWKWGVPALVPVSIDNVLPILSFKTYFVFTQQHKMPGTNQPFSE